MRMKNLFWLAASAALACASCAPVEDPTSSHSVTSPAADKETAVEKMPQEAPRGLKERVEAAIRQVRERDLLVTHSFWTVFHGILGTGLDAQLYDPDADKRFNAVDYIRKGGTIRGMQFLPMKDGLDVRTGPQFVGQGHQDQFVAEMVQWGLPSKTPFVVNGQQYTFADFINHTQMRARVTQKQELSWAILIIGQHKGVDCRWTNSFGEKLRFEDVVRYELNQPIDNAACGGTHRLFGLTWVYHLHLAKGGKIEGVWKDVRDKLVLYQQRARKYRNSDGSFSTRYLAGPGNAHDIQVRIGSSGHVLEWLALSLPDSELTKPWMQEAASALSTMILDNAGAGVESGSLYHAAHGLRIYHDRVFGNLRARGTESPLPLPPAETDAGK